MFEDIKNNKKLDYNRCIYYCPSSSNSQLTAWNDCPGWSPKNYGNGYFSICKYFNANNDGCLEGENERRKRKVPAVPIWE